MGRTLVTASTLAMAIALVASIATLAASGGKELLGLSPGADFGMFYTAAGFVAAGRGAEAYDQELFVQSYQSIDDGRFAGPENRGGYIYPPPFARLLVPLTHLSFDAAFAVWTVAGISVLVLSMGLLGIRGPLAVAAVLLSAPVAMTLRLGQGSFFWLGICVAVLVLGSRGRLVAAGIVAGILILKIPLLLGFGLWWLIRLRESWKALAGLATSATAILVLSFSIDLAMWQQYPEATRAFAGDVAGKELLVIAFAVPDGLTLLGLPAAFAWSVGAIVIAGFGLMIARRPSIDWTLATALAVLVVVAAVPKMMLYDWTLLLVPGVILWGLAEGRRGIMWLAAGVLALSAILSPGLTSSMLHSYGWALQVATIALGYGVVVAIQVSRRNSLPRASEANSGADACRS